MTRDNSRDGGIANQILKRYQRRLAVTEAAMTKRLIPALMTPRSERPAGLQKIFPAATVLHGL